MPARSFEERARVSPTVYRLVSLAVFSSEVDTEPRVKTRI